MATSGVDAVTLDPWHEPGIPSEQQYRSWKQRIKAPYDKHEVDAYTRTRVNLMNGIKVCSFINHCRKLCLSFGW